MPLLLVLILALIAFGLLLVGYLSSSILWAWVSVLVSAVAGVVLLSDALQRRSAVRAGDDAPEPASRAAGREVPAEASAAVAVRPGAAVDGATAVVQAQGRPVAPRRSGPVDPATEVIPVVRSGGWRPDADAERTVVMPVVRPSGSPGTPPGAPAPVPPSGESLSRSVMTDGSDAPDAGPVPTGASAGAPPVDATMVVPAAALGRRPSGDGPAQVVGPAEEPDAPSADPDPGSDPDGAASPDADTAVPPVARGSSAGPPGGPVAEPADDRSGGGSAAPPPGEVPVPSGSGVASDTGSGATGGSDGPAERSSAGAPPVDGPVADAPAADAPPADAPVADAPPVDEPVADGPAADTPPDRAPSVEVPSLDSPPAGAPPVQVPAAQAPVAEPPAEESETEAAALVARLDDEVLVIDEHPRYHVPGCRTLLAAPVIPLPAREAVELGFSPCGWCTPDRTLTARHAPARS